MAQSITSIPTPPLRLVMPKTAINLVEKLSLIDRHWSPRVIAEMNDIQFKLVKLEGDFVWHQHEHTDEVFLVVQGQMVVGFRDHEVTIRQGELFVVPRGVEHITRACAECHALIIEPRGVVNTGDSGGELTAGNDVWI
jgi:mannose-6-phosphate isomerase-like protein (cupin superfamily)